MKGMGAATGKGNLQDLRHRFLPACMPPWQRVWCNSVCIVHDLFDGGHRFLGMRSAPHWDGALHDTVYTGQDHVGVIDQQGIGKF